MAIVGRGDPTTNPYVQRVGRLTSTRGLYKSDFAVGTFTMGRSNVVTQLPVLPYPLYNGRITWQEPFNGNTSGTIEYDEVPLWEFKAIQDAYPNGTQINIYGIPFEATTSPQCDLVIVTPDESVAPERPIYYRVTIQLTGLYSEIDEATQALAEQVGFISYPTGEAVVLDGGKNYGLQGASGNQEFNKVLNAQSSSLSLNGSLSGNTLTVTDETDTKKQVQASTTLTLRGWAFPDEELVAYSATNPILNNGYNDAELTWDSDQSGSQNGNKSDKQRTVFIPKEPLIEEFIEESRDYDQIPENTTVLRDMTSNFDETGDKKVRKKTTNINGKPDREESTIKGFSYTMSDIWNAGSKELLNREPGKFWKDIEYRKTRYVYKRAGTLRLAFAFKSPDGEQVTTVVHPDYWGYPNVSIGAGSANMTSNAEYLVEKVTTGWMSARLKKEDNNRNTLYAKDPYYPYFFPKQIPLNERTVYQLNSARGLYGEKIEPPFTVEYSPWQNLDDRIKEALGAGNVSPTTKGKVAIIKPNLNYVEPLYVAKEISYTNSFTWAVDPDADKPDPKKFIPGTDRVVPAEHLKTGQESYNETTREIRKPEYNDDGTIRQKYYSEQVKTYSSQDPGFDNSIEQIMFALRAGEPPSADYRLQEYQSVQITVDPKNPATLTSGDAQSNLKYYISTPDNLDRIKPGGSASASGAKNLGEAIDRIALDLRREAMSSIGSDAELRGFYPMMRCGQPLSFPCDRHIKTPKGTWRITNLSHQLNYQGMNDDLGLLVTHEPTKASRGLDLDRPVVVTSRPSDENNSQSDGSGGTGDPSINVSLIASIAPVTGDVLPNRETRRNF